MNLWSVESLVAHEGLLRLAGFAVALLVLVVAERARPFRGDARAGGAMRISARQRTNFALALIDTMLLRFAFPVLAVGFAIEVERRGGGLFGALDGPGIVELGLAVLLLDLAIYWQHRLLHRVPWLWPLHRVHHSDVAVDASTGLRFHPLEIAGSMALKLALVALLGPAPLAVMLFELWLSVGSLFTHANIALPARAERLLRGAIVTPAMHRIHHSVRREETDSNYGFNLSLWDRLFDSYRAAPADPERTMALGLSRWREPAALQLRALLWQPFRREPRPLSDEELHDA